MRTGAHVPGRQTASSRLLEAHALYLRVPGPVPGDARDCVRSLVDVYGLWERSEPGKGHAAEQALWKARLEEGDAAPASAPPHGGK